MSLTSKELMLLQDNIKMTQNSIKFMEGCTQICADSQVVSLCQQMSKDHQNDLQTLMKHINSANIQ